MVWLRVVLAACGAAAAVGLLPRHRMVSRAGPSAGEAIGRLRQADRARVLRTIAWRAPALAVGGVAAVFVAPGQAVALALVTWTVAGCLMASSEIKRITYLVNGLSGFATLLAGQAQSATSVVVGVARASKLVSGPVQDAAQVLADGLSNPGLEGAAKRFAAQVPHSLGGQIAEALVIAHTAGGKWRPPLEALGEEADQSAQTLQLIRQKAAGNLSSLGIVAAMGVGIIGVSARMVSDMGEWFATTAGQLTLVGSAAAFWMVCNGAIGRVRAEVVR